MVNKLCHKWLNTTGVQKWQLYYIQAAQLCRSVSCSWRLSGALLPSKEKEQASSWMGPKEISYVCSFLFSTGFTVDSFHYISKCSVSCFSAVIQSYRKVHKYRNCILLLYPSISWICRYAELWAGMMYIKIKWAV